MRRFFPWLAIAGLLWCSSPALARGPYVTLRDEIGFASKKFQSVEDLEKSAEALRAAYEDTGAERPEVLSVWTTFPTNGNSGETLFVPYGNDVTGIGLEGVWGGDGTMKSKAPPLRAVLLHNDITQLAKRAQRSGAQLDGFAEYLFLLELSHLWGPAVQLPPTDASPSTNGLIGFDLHWSFYMDAGGSAAGGNKWTDNGDGTFTTAPQSAKDIGYSMLDLYLMGLASESEVPPFGLLENVTPPAGVTDPLWGGAIAPHTFPWFGAQPVTVKASRRAITIADVVAANGKRAPAKGAAQTSWSVGIVLLVGQNATDEQIAGYEKTFDPIASALAPRFQAATQGRGTLRVVTTPPAPEPDAGVDPPDASVSAAPPPVSTQPGGCNAGGGPATLGFPLALSILLGRLVRRRVRA